MENKQKCVELRLKWGESEYGQFMYESGIGYLRAYISSEYDAIIDEISRSALFWNWWKKHWDARDIAFIETTEGSPLSITGLRAIYMELHNPVTLAAELYPTGQVLCESYATMISKIQKKEGQYV